MNRGSKKLTQKQIEEIKRNRGRGGRPYKDLAREFGVHLMTINYYASQSLSESVRESRRKYREKNIEKIREHARMKNQELKFNVLNFYKRTEELVCECCKEENLEFLSLDHINRDGSKHKKEIKMSLYLWIKKNNFPHFSFRVLCMNCNHSYGHYGRCPHRNN